MRGAEAWEAGAPLRVHDDLERRAVGAGEVVVRIRAAGVCQTDISLSHGAFGQSMPVVLGHEGTGVVEKVGADSNLPRRAPGVGCARCVAIPSAWTALGRQSWNEVGPDWDRAGLILPYDFA